MLLLLQVQNGESINIDIDIDISIDIADNDSFVHSLDFFAEGEETKRVSVSANEKAFCDATTTTIPFSTTTRTTTQVVLATVVLCMESSICKKNLFGPITNDRRRREYNFTR